MSGVEEGSPGSAVGDIDCVGGSVALLAGEGEGVAGSVASGGRVVVATGVFSPGRRVADDVGVGVSSAGGSVSCGVAPGRVGEGVAGAPVEGGWPVGVNVGIV